LFGHFKDEVDYEDCQTFEELKAKIANYVHYYNHERQTAMEFKKDDPGRVPEPSFKCCVDVFIPCLL